MAEQQQAPSGFSAQDLQDLQAIHGQLKDGDPRKDKLGTVLQQHGVEMPQAAPVEGTPKEDYHFMKEGARSVLPSTTAGDYLQGPASLVGLNSKISPRAAWGAMGEMGENAVKAQVGEFGKAYDKTKSGLKTIFSGDGDLSTRMQQGQGEITEAMGHGLAGVTPLIGPAAAHAGEQTGSGDISGGLGRGAGLIGSVLAPKVLQSGNRALKTGMANFLIEGDPKSLMTRAIRPPVTNPELESAMVDRMGQVHQKSGEIGRPLNTLDNFKESVDAAKADSGKAYGDLIDQTRGTPINVRPVGRAIMQSTPATDRLINPGAIQKNATVANQFDRNMPIEDADAIRVDTNAKLKDFYNKSGGDKAAARSNPEVARTEAMNTGTRNAVYGELKGQTGINPEPIQNAYGQLEEISDAAARRGVVYGRQVPISMGENIGAAAGGVKGFLTSKILKQYNTPDALIETATRRWAAENGIDPNLPENAPIIGRVIQTYQQGGLPGALASEPTRDRLRLRF